ncbi:sialidase family protein [Microbispora corallina]|uniref:sialidase family protein n=1 Tax=Microbispora corallina TaxID=83302 RepID=UPI00194DF099|nr:sialidase family protein [Microbispora corallina]
MTTPARSWPDTDVVGAAVSAPVTVYSAVRKDPSGELVHEGNRVPDIVALDAARLVVGWRAGVADPGDPAPKDQGAIKIARSEDGGRTWTVGTLAADDAVHRYHYVVFLNDSGTLHALLGRITIAADRDAEGDLDGFPVEMTVKRSTDGGRTWADVPVTVAVPPNPRGVVVAGKPIRHDGVWLVPYWRSAQGTTKAGVLRSSDLVTWTPGALAENPPGVSVEEPQVAVSQDDPKTLVMVARTLTGGPTAEARDAHYRTHAAYAATATSTDGGLTWSRMTLDPDLPNYYVKTFFATDANGLHLAIYNTLAGPFTGTSESKPDQYREVLYYKVKRPGTPWGPGRLFADGRRSTTGAGRGWDVYASADEYAPGRFAVVWEHNQTDIRVARLDVSNAFTGVTRGTAGWTAGGAAQPTPSGGFRLAGASISRPYGPAGGFVLTVRGGVTRFPESGEGLGVTVSTGARALTVAVRPDGLYALGTAGWTRVHAPSEAWRVIVDAAGTATAEGGARWSVPVTGSAAGVSAWSDGEAVLDLIEVADHVAGGSWDGWALDAPGARLLDGGLRLRSAGGRVVQAVLPLDVTRGCDFTVEVRGRVIDDSALDPRTGLGVSFGTKVANGARRLMLTVQKGGVWTMTKGSTVWTRVLSLGGAGDLATWTVVVDSAGVARLLRDGAGTGATWVVQDSRQTPQVAHWVAGTPGGNTAEAHIDRTIVTATLSLPSV